MVQVRLCFFMLAVVAVLAVSCSSGGDRPRIDGTLPGSATAQSETFVMIQGDHFARDAQAQIGSSALGGVTWINARLLSAQIPGGLPPGSYNISVKNPGGGASTLPGAFTVVAPATAPRTPAPPSPSATRPPIATATAPASVPPSTVPASVPPSTVPSPSPTPQPTPPPRTAVPAPSATAPVAPTLPATVVRPAPTTARGQSPANLAGQWAIVDTLTYGPGAGQSYSFTITIEQSGNSITGSGDGISLIGTVDGRQVHADYLQSNGSGGSFDWQLDSSNTLSGTFTNSLGNGGDSTARHISGDAAASRPLDWLRSIIGGTGNGRGKKNR